MSRRMVNRLHFVALALGLISGLLFALPPSANRLENLMQQGPSELGNDPVLMVGVILWIVACVCITIGGFYRGRDRFS